MYNVGLNVFHDVTAWLYARTIVLISIAMCVRAKREFVTTAELEANSLTQQ